MRLRHSAPPSFAGGSAARPTECDRLAAVHSIITIGKDECHVVHLLRRRTISVRMIDLHLVDVHAGTRSGMDDRFSSRGGQEKHLHSERDEDNCDDSDGLMYVP